MKRQELIDMLSFLQPALASNNLVPILGHFYFMGEIVAAYNDRIGVYMPYKSGFKGCVPGATLLGLLKASTADEVLLTANDDKEFLLKARTANIKLAMQPIEDAPLEFIKDRAPGADKATKIKVKASILHAALTRCLRSTTDDTSVPEHLGVTFLPGDDGVHLYSTNRKTLSHFVLPAAKIKKRAIVPTEFCTQVLALIDKDSDENVEFEVSPELGYANLVSEYATLYGRLIEAEKPLSFLSILEHHFPAKLKKQLIKVPSFMPGAIERSIVMAAAGAGEARMQIIVQDNRFKLITKAMVGDSSIGTINDAVDLKDPGHPDVSCSLNPKDVKLAMEYYNKMAVTADALVMTGEYDDVFLVSATKK